MNVVLIQESHQLKTAIGTIAIITTITTMTIIITITTIKINNNNST